VFTLIFHKTGNICDGDEGVVGFVQFIITCEHSSELFDITEVTLYNIPLFVQFFIVLPRFFVVAFWWNHRTHPTLFRLRSASIAFLPEFLFDPVENAKVDPATKSLINHAPVSEFLRHRSPSATVFCHGLQGL